MSEVLRDAAGLEAWLTAHKIPVKPSGDGAILVPVAMMPGVNGQGALRFRPGMLEIVTLLPVPVRPEGRAAVDAAVAAANKALAGSLFTVDDGGIRHVARAELSAAGEVAAVVVEGLLGTARAACDRHFRTLLGAAMGVGSSPPPPVAAPPRAPSLISHVATRLSDEQIAELRLATARQRPTFAPRMAHPLLVEEVLNPWFKNHRILHVQSPSPMPAMGVMIGLAPGGELSILAGQPDALTALARAEGVQLADDAAARAYANVTTSWTRSADFPEIPVGKLDDIPWRPSLTDADRALIDGLRGEVASRLAPLAFGRAGDGWRLDVWLVSVSRLVHRVADVAPDGALRVSDEVVVPSLPVFPGRAWGMVGGRLVPVG